MIAPWLKTHLIRTGTWNADGCSRKAQVRRHSCDQVVIYGLDADTCGWPTVADPTPLTPLGEALAVIVGRATYSLRRTGRRIELDHRSPLHIAGSPAGTRDYDVVAAHACGSPPLPTTRSAFDPIAIFNTDGPPPF